MKKALLIGSFTFFALLIGALLISQIPDTGGGPLSVARRLISPGADTFNSPNTGKKYRIDNSKSPEITTALASQGLENHEIEVDVNTDDSHPVGWYADKEGEISGYSFNVRGGKIIVSIYLKPNRFTAEEELYEINKNYFAAILGVAEFRKSSPDYKAARTEAFSLFQKAYETKVFPVVKK